jgi:hypothetical protein
MAVPKIVSREEWLQARLRLLAQLRSRFGRSEDWEEPKGRARVLHGADPTFTD